MGTLSYEPVSKNEDDDNPVVIAIATPVPEDPNRSAVRRRINSVAYFCLGVLTTVVLCSAFEAYRWSHRDLPTAVGDGDGRSPFGTEVARGDDNDDNVVHYDYYSDGSSNKRGSNHDEEKGEAAGKEGADSEEEEEVLASNEGEWLMTYGEGEFEKEEQDPTLWSLGGSKYVKQDGEWDDYTFYVRRVCRDCAPSHQNIIYKRLTKVPATMDVEDLFLSNWFDTDNVLGVDFNLYSNYVDARNDLNEWKFCNYNDPGIGFPRDCGLESAVIFQWNSLTRGGKSDVSYYVLAGNPTIAAPGVELNPPAEASCPLGLQDINDRHTNCKAYPYQNDVYTKKLWGEGCDKYLEYNGDNAKCFEYCHQCDVLASRWACLDGCRYMVCKTEGSFKQGCNNPPPTEWEPNGVAVNACPMPLKEFASYELVASGDCTGTAPIETVDECKAAIKEVFGLENAPIVIWDTPSYAKGCFKHNYSDPGSVKAHQAPTLWVLNHNGGPGTSGHCTGEPGYAACICRARIGE